MSCLSSIEKISKFSPKDVEREVKWLLEGCPSASWPDGMPGSLDPKLIVIGVSPGNSPGQTPSLGDLCSKPGVEPASSFQYDDASRYWEKVRSLALRFISRNEGSITEPDALLLTSHFNLGTGTAGKASKEAVERDYVVWVSQLLNQKLEPDLVVLFGLWGLIRDKDISEWWNHAGGLPVKWHKPDREIPFDGGLPKKWNFREWNVVNARGHALRIVTWPNHPSRPPVSSMGAWDVSVKEYIEHFVRPNE